MQLTTAVHNRRFFFFMLEMDAFVGQRLVIFGCGYVGTAVARQALARGVQVTALTRNAATATVLRAEGAGTVVADLASDTWHDEIPPAPEFVVNCVSSGGGGLAGYRRNYVEGMRSIVAWARRHGPVGTLVYTGSTSVYPQGGGVCVDETATTDGGDGRAGILLEAETLLRTANGSPALWSRPEGLAGEGTRPPSCWARWFVLRLAGIYGPERHHLIGQIRAGEVPGTGSHRLNLIHRDDAVSALFACLDAPATVKDEIFNVADDGAAPKVEVVTWLAAQLGASAPRFTPARPEGRERLTPDRIIANAKLKTMLGWQPRYATFREGYANLLSP